MKRSEGGYRQTREIDPEAWRIKKVINAQLGCHMIATKSSVSTKNEEKNG